MTAPRLAPAPSCPADDGPRASMAMAATLHWFLIDLVARGLPLDTAEAALRDGIRTQARALRETGLR